MLQGAVSLLELRRSLLEVGIELVVTGDPEVAIFGKGYVYTHEIPGLITSQTSYTVLQYGNRWVCYDLGDVIPIPSPDPGKGGYVTVNRSDATVQRLVDQLEAARNVYTLELWVVDASANVAYPLVGTGVDLSWLIASVTSTAGEPFSFKDSTTIYVSNFTVVPGTNNGTSQLQSSETGRDAGLIMTGKIRELPQTLQITGNIEISSNDSATQKSEKTVDLNLLTRVDDWTTVATLSKADAALRLRPFGVNVGGGSYLLKVRVRLSKGGTLDVH